MTDYTETEIQTARMDIIQKLFIGYTNGLIINNCSKQYHDTTEWEYDFNVRDENSPLILSVWRLSSRKDKPVEITLQNQDKKNIYEMIKFITNK